MFCSVVLDVVGIAVKKTVLLKGLYYGRTFVAVFSFFVLSKRVELLNITN